MSTRLKTHSSRFLLMGLLAVGVVLTGCKGEDATAPAAPPVAKASVEVLNLHTTEHYPDYAGACQTNGLVEFRAFEGDELSGAGSEPVTLEWTFMVNRWRGPLEPAPDWGPGMHVWTDTDTDKPMAERILTLPLLTIGEHEVTLTVRTRDGRATSTTLLLLVTSCENCGE